MMVYEVQLKLGLGPDGALVCLLKPSGLCQALAGDLGILWQIRMVPGSQVEMKPTTFSVAGGR
jgi:hypothetical protein